MNKPIGVFDSGIGGLTVVKAIRQALPEENIIYLGDTAHVPYGTRSKEQIIQLSLGCADFLSRFDIKAMVIACNTADSAAREELEKKYPSLPIFGVVKPAAAAAAGQGKAEKIGVIATNATIESASYEKTIAALNPLAQVFGIACPLLVPLVENYRYKKDDKVIELVLREYLQGFDSKGISSLVLGCTHYPLLKDLIEFIMPDVKIISSSDEAAKALKEGLLERKLLNNSGKKGEYFYYSTDNPSGFEKSARLFLGDAIDGEVRLAQIKY